MFQDLIDVAFTYNTLLQIPDTGLIYDLLNSNPNKNITGWFENRDGSDYGSGEGQGPGFAFGPDVVSRFCQKHDIDLIVRAHQVVEDGYEIFSNRQLVTICSAPNYRGEYDNAGAIMSVDETLLCSFQVCSLYSTITISLKSLIAGEIYRY